MLLDVKDLKIHFKVREGWLGKVRGMVRAVDGVNLSMETGETLGLVGESGCGKTTLGRGLLNLVPLTSGTVRFESQDLTTLPPEALRQLRPRMQMIFQDPVSSLNPRMTVESLVTDALLDHKQITPAETRDKARELLAQVGLGMDLLRRFPHELSGGQRQRVSIARALSLNPKLIVCDEPVSALDVSIQAQVLNLLKDLQQQLGLTLLFISHSLGVVRFIAGRVAVMYLGRVVELARSEILFSKPRHPYTKALLQSIPANHPDQRRTYAPLKGDVPNPFTEYTGCSFYERCPERLPQCALEPPVLRAGDKDHHVSCWAVTP
ncbi:MAG: ATP-binding cassette domain-containing protein [Deltaproteobacteria bacterium]|nr:ATP-binding cassette domain-containing protein [Deltaproteobacteria bacterium]